jgi:hypothetical protein
MRKPLKPNAAFSEAERARVTAACPLSPKRADHGKDLNCCSVLSRYDLTSPRHPFCRERVRPGNCLTRTADLRLERPAARRKWA